MNPLADRPPPPFTTRTRYLVERQNIHGDSGKRMKDLQRVSVENTVIGHWLSYDYIRAVNKYLSDPVPRAS
jgi:hypothetical protein